MRRAYRALLCLGLGSSACFPPGEGIEPPLERIYFPVGVGLSADNNRLFVVNSDFDLQFNSGSVQLVDLARARELAPTIDANGVDCGESGPQDEFQLGAVPGPCKPIPMTRDGNQLLLDAVGIGAFATDLVVAQRPADAVEGAPTRLLVPVRGDTTLHWIDFTGDDRLDCGQSNHDGSCDSLHRSGDNSAAENTRDVELPAEPFGVAATADGRTVVLTHQTEGAASVFTHDWDEVGPRLQFVTGGMPSRPIGVASIPAPAAKAQLNDPSFAAYTPGFLVTFRNASEVRLLRYFDDAASEPARPFLQSAGVVSVQANALNFDSRGIAIDDSNRVACETACAGDPSCILGCAGTPLDVFVANRAPASLLVGQTRVSDGGARVEDLPRFYDSIPLPFGPSRVVLGHVINPQGQPERRVFVLCFDARRIVIYDPARRREEAWIDTGRGPHALAIDDATVSLMAPHRHFGYIAHFTDSYIGMIDLDQRNPQSYGKIVASLGAPAPPRASK